MPKQKPEPMNFFEIGKQRRSRVLGELQAELKNLWDEEQGLMNAIRPSGTRYLHSMGWAPYEAAPKEWARYKAIGEKRDVILKQMAELESKKGSMRTRLSTKIDIAVELDAIATEIEAQDPVVALAIDQISDKLEGHMAGEVGDKKTVGINDFVKRHTKADFVGTKVTETQLEELRKKAEDGVNAGRDKRGYADFVRIVDMKDPSILCPVAKITPENKKFLKTEKTKRREEEKEYEHSYFESKDVKGTPSHHVDIILYTKEQLDKEGEKNTGSDLDMISINAQISEKGAPITPETMRRNIQGPAFGGSGFQHSKDEISESEKFWADHAMIK